MTWQDGWWAYVFIAIAGWLATDIWRWLGVITGNRLRDDSEALNWVRAVATALVAAVIAKLILYPTGVLEQSPLWLRAGAVALGAAAFFLFGRKPAIGIASAIAALALGLWWLGF
ncbi:AzlD domain-containing protein [Ensifer adhaerens]|jgi:branched-subunit amino acid transport protein|uniref:AzlD domain-containing protein n=1 Tax=Ensifer adhaerens TaxID=106592 RepID=A0A9Q8Y9N2_ENSAD|nr:MULTISPECIES: AzlD domain-containing protein [Ensifer]KSV65544.1 branched-chain amino acid transport [Sinorhizobium sp. GL2]KSV67666.1 branched-chain amino acid transport [Sinorhizobium sp. GW3]OWZ92074.1 branched-chain amino acid transport [Sinorhizobium sp. LM21]ANK72271.1 branched-chain amino acid transport [Ensifer adhaerens]KQX21073.1 branched-chain amino acid transport [Ensifer sp. Root423]